MERFLRKIIAVALVSAVIISAVPLTSYATGDLSEAESDQTLDNEQLSDLIPADTEDSDTENGAEELETNVPDASISEEDIGANENTHPDYLTPDEYDVRSLTSGYGLLRLNPISVPVEDIEGDPIYGQGIKLYAASSDPYWDKFSSTYYKSVLNANQQALYNTLYAQCMEYLTTTKNIERASNLNTSQYYMPWVPVSGLSVDQARATAALFANSNPQFFFLAGNGVAWGTTGNTLTHVTLNFYSDYANGAVRAQKREQYKSKIEGWLSTINAQTSERDKAKKIYDIIAANVAYDYSALSNADLMQRHQGPHSAVFEGKTVCAGYAELFELLARGAGLQCITVTSYNHEWNQVMIDGDWYNVDITWDDSGSWASTTYFLKSDYNFQHITNSRDQIQESHVPEAYYNGIRPSCDYDYGEAPPAAERNLISIESVDNLAGKFTIAIKNPITSGGLGTGANAVRAAVWSQSNQSDLYWYNATKGSDGIYRANVDVHYNKYYSGKFNIHVYNTNRNGKQTFAGSTTCTLTPPASNVAASINSSDARYMDLSATNVYGTGGLSLKGVRFAVWSNVNGQDDIRWYDGVKSGNTYEVLQTKALLSNHKGTGVYNVHVYATMSNGSSKYVGSKTFNVSAASATGVKADTFDHTKGTYKVRISGVKSPGGVSKIEVATWSASNQNDIKWYSAYASGSDYVADINVANHKYNLGPFYNHVYITTGVGEKQYLGAVNDVKITPPNQSVTASVINTSTSGNDQKNIRITANNVFGTGSSLQGVRFAVWSVDKGQDDLRWHDARKSGTTYTYDVPLSAHLGSGVYNIHAYATMTGNVSKFVGSATVNVLAPTSTVSIENVKNLSGKYDVIVSNIRSIAGIKGVRVATWSASNQNDIKWYDAKLVNGNYVANVDVAYHKYNQGPFYNHVYLTTGQNQSVYIGQATSTKFQPITSKVTASVTGNNERLSLSASGIFGTGGLSVKDVRFAVWSNVNGQDDLRWYTFPSYTSGNVDDGTAMYKGEIGLSGHKGSGIYNVHVYATMSNGSQKFVGSATVDVPGISGSVEVKNIDKAKGTYDVIVTVDRSIAGISKLQVAAWSASNQSDLKWYNFPLTPIEGNKYKVTVNKANHKNSTGPYINHVYLLTGQAQNLYLGQQSNILLR